MKSRSLRHCKAIVVPNLVVSGHPGTLITRSLLTLWPCHRIYFFWWFFKGRDLVWIVGFCRLHRDFRRILSFCIPVVSLLFICFLFFWLFFFCVSLRSLPYPCSLVSLPCPLRCWSVFFRFCYVTCYNICSSSLSASWRGKPPGDPSARANPPFYVSTYVSSYWVCIDSARFIDMFMDSNNEGARMPAVEVIGRPPCVQVNSGGRIGAVPEQTRRTVLDDSPIYRELSVGRISVTSSTEIMVWHTRWSVIGFHQGPLLGVSEVNGVARRPMIYRRPRVLGSGFEYGMSPLHRSH